MEIRLILGDQLYLHHSWFDEFRDDIIYVMFEMRQETDYTKHHIQKVIGFFASMRQFAKELELAGHTVLYFTLDDSQNKQNLSQNLKEIIRQTKATSFAYQEPDEYRLDTELNTFCKQLSIPSKVYGTEHFLTDRNEFASFFKGKKKWVMEYFYRNMRKKYNLLMIGGQPEGGDWNYDKFNRNKWKGKEEIPKAYLPKSGDLENIYKMITNQGVKTLGHFDSSQFLFATSRTEALKQLDYFCKNLLPHFGDYQDAMHSEEVNLFHSRISFSLNTKQITPIEVIERAISCYRSKKRDISLSQVEGFVRQILGWREYMRGLYWMEMPNYKRMNKLDNTNSLPRFYWTGETKMNCLHKTITNSLDNAYAHHIQRLMITGNFALLNQTHPDEVDDWYLGIYADAIEWVQLPNTRGMSQFADGGIVATKPYVSSGSYIQKMSNYCEGCVYNQKKRLGDDACPFNSLYWNFLDDKRIYFAKNNRMAMMLRLLDKINPDELRSIKQRAYKIMEQPDIF